MVMDKIDNCFWIFEVLLFFIVFEMLLNLFVLRICWNMLGLGFNILEFIKVFFIWVNWLFSVCNVIDFVFFLLFVLMIVDIKELYVLVNLWRDFLIVDKLLSICLLLGNDVEIEVKLDCVWCKEWFSCGKFRGMIWELVKFKSMFFISKVMVWWILNFGLVNCFI